MQLRPRLKRFSQFLFSEKTAPFAFLAVLLFSFGIFIPAWGFYYDDWPTIYMFHSHGSILDYYQFDRPFAAWTEILFSTILGTNPIAWQIANLLMRWLAVTSLWWCFRLVWPRANRLVFGIALLFAVHPVFSLQPIAVTFTKLWFWYALYFLSLGFMVIAVQKPRKFYLFTALSLLTGAIHILSIEYFWGLELLRPALLWIVAAKNSVPMKRNLGKTFLRWSPYLALLSGMVIWRVFFAQFATDGFYFSSDPNAPGMLINLFKSPLETIPGLVQLVFHDTLYILAGLWRKSPLTL